MIELSRRAPRSFDFAKLAVTRLSRRTRNSSDRNSDGQNSDDAGKPSAARRSKWSKCRSSLHQQSTRPDDFSDDERDEMDELEERLSRMKMMEGESVSKSISFHLRRLSSRRSLATDTSSNRAPAKQSLREESLGEETDALWKHTQRKDEKEDTCSPALAEVLTVQAVSKERFLANKAEGYRLSVTSFGETKFFKQLAHEEDYKVAGEAEVDAAKLARMQAMTLHRLCRVYPSGLRVSSSNFPPLQAWRAGVQCVAVNLQTNDLTAQLHHALFEGSDGYVLKPKTMRAPAPDWPPISLTLERVTVKILSLHGLPRPSESRPRLEGVHSRCHAYEPQLSGPPPLLPSQGGVSSPRVSIELLPIGGTCGIALELPARRLKTLHYTKRAAENGLNACFGETFHCLAQAPRETIVRVAVQDGHGDKGDKHVAYETCMLSAPAGLKRHQPLVCPGWHPRPNRFAWRP